MVRLAAGLGVLITATALAAVAQTARAPRTVTITATPGRLAISAESIGAGPVTFVLQNRAGIVVSAQLLAVRDDHTPAEAVALLASGALLPDWIAAVGGVAAVWPGGNAAVTHSLPPGGYVVASTVPDTVGAPQYRRGYARGLRATGRGEAASVPGVVAVLTASSTAFRLQRVTEQDGRRIELVSRQRGRAIPAGEQVIEVETVGGTSHEIVLVRMDPANTLRKYVQWFSGGQRGAGPGRPSGGVGLIPGGRRAWLRARLESGTYWLFCGAVHAGGRRGYETGEYAQISVR